MKSRTLLFVVIALGVAGYFLWRALESGNPLFYFLSAVGFGMVIAALQQLFGKRPPRS